MRIIENKQDMKLYTEMIVTEIDKDDNRLQQTTTVIAEHIIHVYVNEIPTLNVTCTPSDLADLVLGRLLSEGMIQDAGEIDTVEICEHGRKAKVLLFKCPTDNSTSLKPVIPVKWEPAWIWKLTDLFCKDTPLHQKTHSTHSCYLMVNGSVVFQCEDIGRHNALDKVIGHALHYDYDLREAIVYITGRVPTDMVIKAIRSRISVLVSKEAPTREAILLAEKYHLTLIGCAKCHTVKIFTKMQ